MNKQLIVSTLLLLSAATVCVAEKAWTIETQEEWKANAALQKNIEYTDGQAVPTDSTATYQSVLKRFPEKRSASSLTISQSTDWLNWSPVPNVGPANLGDAPIALQLGPNEYWMFGRYGKSRAQKAGTFVGEPVTLEGYDIELKTSPYKDQFDAPGGLKEGKGGYHAWHSRDMKTWIHHGPVSEHFSRWMTTAEVVDGKFYLYYDFPNDQDPHLYIDEDLTDGEPGTMMGMVFKDPSPGSDCAVIRALDGQFHVIAEDWSPINASKRSWDSPLAIHGVSPDGVEMFQVVEQRPVDNRTTPTGKFGEYPHPHWHLEDPANYPGKPAAADIPRHRIKKGQVMAYATYEIHEPEQEAYGDWAAISIGGQYYLFGDFDQHEGGTMSTCWFTSDDINKKFTWCGHIGKGHPDPEILFAEGRFYLLTQVKTDYVSPGPWVETVEVRVGVDTSNDGKVDQWSEWREVSEKYDYIKGFSKQIKRVPAQRDLKDVPEGYGFQFEIRMTGSTDNGVLPILDKVELSFES